MYHVGAILYHVGAFGRKMTAGVTMEAGGALRQKPGQAIDS